MKSNKWQFNIADLYAWVENAKWFLAGPIIIYLVSVMATVSQPGHIIVWTDFLPGNAVAVAVAQYFLNRAIDFFRRYQSGK